MIHHVAIWLPHFFKLVADCRLDVLVWLLSSCNTQKQINWLIMVSSTPTSIALAITAWFLETNCGVNAATQRRCELRTYRKSDVPSATSVSFGTQSVLFLQWCHCKTTRPNNWNHHHHPHGMHPFLAALFLLPVKLFGDLRNTAKNFRKPTICTVPALENLPMLFQTFLCFNHN